MELAFFALLTCGKVWYWLSQCIYYNYQCIYFQCSHGDCAHHNNIYIDLATTTLSRRLTMHVASGGPKVHALENHNLTATRDDLVNNTKILFHEVNHNKLSMMEALLIRKLQPPINNHAEHCMVSTEHLNFSHSLPLQLHVLLPPTLFTPNHIVPIQTVISPLSSR